MHECVKNQYFFVFHLLEKSYHLLVLRGHLGLTVMSIENEMLSSIMEIFLSALSRVLLTNNRVYDVIEFLAKKEKA